MLLLDALKDACVSFTRLSERLFVGRLRGLERGNVFLCCALGIGCALSKSLGVFRTQLSETIVELFLGACSIIVVSLERRLVFSCRGREYSSGLFELSLELRGVIGLESTERLGMVSLCPLERGSGRGELIANGRKRGLVLLGCFGERRDMLFTCG